MEALLRASKKIQSWIHSHPGKATIVQNVIDEFDKAISDTEERLEYVKQACSNVLTTKDLQYIDIAEEQGAPFDEPGCFNPDKQTNTK